MVAVATLKLAFRIVKNRQSYIIHICIILPLPMLLSVFLQIRCKYFFYKTHEKHVLDEMFGLCLQLVLARFARWTRQ